MQRVSWNPRGPLTRASLLAPASLSAAVLLPAFFGSSFWRALFCFGGGDALLLSSEDEESSEESELSDEPLLLLLLLLLSEPLLSEPDAADPNAGSHPARA